MTIPGSQYDEFYREHYSKFREGVRRAQRVSYGYGDICGTTSKEHYACALFTKLTVSSISLLRLCPDPADAGFVYAHLDFTSGAALTRVLMDTYVALFHFGIEDCSAEEYELRQLLLFWRDVQLRLKIGAYQEVEAQKIAAEQKADLSSRLDANVVWRSLDPKLRKQTLAKNNMLHSPEETLKRAGFDAELCRQMYAYWSGHTHCDSIAFIRMAEDRRGAGFYNEADVSLLAGCLEFANLFLLAATNPVDEMFAGAEKRTLSVAGFNPESNVQPRRPWFGQSITELRKLQ